MTVFRITIPGKPYAKRRPRAGVVPKTGRSRTYNAAGNRTAEDAVAYHVGQIIKTPIEGPVRVTITAIFEIPKSWPKYKQREAAATLHTQKPDFDNVAKWVLDGMNRVAFADDGQVADCRTIKIWGKRAETLIEVAPAPRAFGDWSPNDFSELRRRILGEGQA